MDWTIIYVMLICLVITAVNVKGDHGCSWPDHKDPLLKYTCKTKDYIRCDRREPFVPEGATVMFKCKFPQAKVSVDTADPASGDAAVNVTCGSDGYEQAIPKRCIYACGESNHVSDQMETSNARLGDWPWQVVLLQGGRLCSGALINPVWVLTSTNCVKDGENVEVRRGLIQTTNLPHTYYQVQRSIPGPDGSGLILLQIPATAPIGHVGIACLPERDSLQENDIAVVVGFQDFLQQTPVQVLSFGTDICVKTRGDQASMDDEGSLLVKSSIKGNYFVLYGIKDEPVPDCEGIAFSDVSAHVGWIRNEMDKWEEVAISFS